AGGDGPRLPRLVAEQVQVGGAIVVLQPRRHSARIHLGEAGQRLLDAVLQQQVGGGGEAGGVGQQRGGGEEGEGGGGLLQDAWVDDLPPPAQGVGAGVDQGLVLQVLVLVPGHRVDDEQRAAQRAAGLGDEWVGVQQELAGHGGVVVVQAVGPDGRLV